MLSAKKPQEGDEEVAREARLFLEALGSFMQDFTCCLGEELSALEAVGAIFGEDCDGWDGGRGACRTKDLDARLRCRG